MVEALDAPPYRVTPRSEGKPEDGDPAAPSESAHERILSCLPLVDSIARQVHGSLPSNASLELHDLTQAGLLGLVNAGRSYNPATAVPFSMYARYRIEGEMLDSMRRQDLAPRRLRRWQKQVSAARRELMGVLQREPSEEELCERLMISAVEMRNRSAALKHTGPGGQGAEAAGPEDICARRQLREVLDRLIDSLTPGLQQVIRLRYCRHMNMKEIGAELGVQESRVSEMHRTALEEMGRILKESGIGSPAHI
jgi:RNA polymerase sigma factor for flagellar operon FliA